MKKSRHAEVTMIKAIQRLERGVPAETICRELSISRITLYNWRNKHSSVYANHAQSAK
ncbi:MAG: transposase [Bacteroidales bacterium]